MAEAELQELEAALRSCVARKAVPSPEALRSYLHLVSRPTNSGGDGDEGGGGSAIQPLPPYYP